MGNDAPEKSQRWLDRWLNPASRLGRIFEQAIASAIGTFAGGIALGLAAILLDLVQVAPPVVWLLVVLLLLFLGVSVWIVVRSKRPLDEDEIKARMAVLDLYLDSYRPRAGRKRAPEESDVEP